MYSSKMEGQNCSKKHEQNSLQDAQVAVVMVPFPAQGHLNQLLHLSHLISPYEITVHYVGSTTHNRQAKLRYHGRDLEKSLSKIHFHDLELPPISSTPPSQDPTTHFPTQLVHPLFDLTLALRQPVYQLLQELATKFRRIVVVHDSLTASAVQDAKSIPNAEAYTFISISAFTWFVRNWGATTEKPFQLDSDVIPGCLPSFEGCFSPEVEYFGRYQAKVADFQSGALYNTCRLIEGKYVELLGRLPKYAGMKHFAVGPFNPVVKTRSGKDTHGCLEWLDKQEMDSVIYISFGSTTTMSDEQIRELALGLERSGQKFIWVLRNADKPDIFAQDEAKSPRVPEGYEERVADRGLVIRHWAPQLEILAHSSTGGFMSHCGWNSCLESISMGVPIAAWPMHSDQPANSILVAEVLKIGTLVWDWAKRAELITANTIENVVRKLMASKEGAEMRKRAAELGEKVRGSIAEGGASHVEMEAFIAHITR